MEEYPNKKKFIFFLVTENGEEVIWQGLTEIQANKLRVATMMHPPPNILKFGTAKQPEEPMVDKEKKV
jgi:hypothetical protein